MWTDSKPCSRASERGAANAILVIVMLLVVGAVAVFFYPRGDQGTTTPEDNQGEAQPSEELPGGKTVKPVPEDGAQSAAKGSQEGGDPARGKGVGGGPHKLTAVEKQVMGWEDTLNDQAASTKDKLAALRELRKRDKTGEQYAPMMIDLLKEAKDDELAVGVILEMRKRKNHVFGQPLLDAAVRSESKRARVAAVRTLGAYLEEPAIRSMLKQMAERGNDPELNDEIRAALEGRKDHWQTGQGR